MTVCMQRLYQEMFPHQLASRADKENLSVLDDLVPPLPPSVSPMHKHCEPQTIVEVFIRMPVHLRTHRYYYLIASVAKLSHTKTLFIHPLISSQT